MNYIPKDELLSKYFNFVIIQNRADIIYRNIIRNILNKFLKVNATSRQV